MIFKLKTKDTPASAYRPPFCSAFIYTYFIYIYIYIALFMLCILMSHYSDVIMGTKASQITSLTIVYSTVYSDADQRKHQSSASLAFVWGINRSPLNSPHEWPVTRKMFPFDDVIMVNAGLYVPASSAIGGKPIKLVTPRCSNANTAIVLHSKSHRVT